MTKFWKGWLPESLLYQCTLVIDMQSTESTFILSWKFSFREQLRSTTFAWQSTASRNSHIFLDSFVVLKIMLIYAKILQSTKMSRPLENLNLKNFHVASRFHLCENCRQDRRGWMLASLIWVCLFFGKKQLLLYITMLCSKSWSCVSKSQISSNATFICFSNASFCKAKHECKSLHSAVFRSRPFWSLERENFKTWNSWQEKFEGLPSVFCFLGAGLPSYFVTCFFGSGGKTKLFGIPVFCVFTDLFELHI